MKHYTRRSNSSVNRDRGAARVDGSCHDGVAIAPPITPAADHPWRKRWQQEHKPDISTLG